MESSYVKNLIMRVIQNSESSIWEDAVEEWEITDCEEDDSASEICICGKENIKYLFTIRKTINGNMLYPIGSSCINKFNRVDMKEETSLYEGMFKLLHAVESNRYLSLSPDKIICFIQFLMEGGYAAPVRSESAARNGRIIPTLCVPCGATSKR